MEKLKIEKCSCGSEKTNMCSFQHSHFGYFVCCDDCKKEVYDKALSIQDPRKNDISILSKMQEYVIIKWNGLNYIKKSENNA